MRMEAALLLLLQPSGGKSCIMALVPKCKEQQTEWMNYSIVGLHEWKPICLQQPYPKPPSAVNNRISSCYRLVHSDLSK